MLLGANACAPAETTSVTFGDILLEPQSAIFGMRRHREQSFIGSHVDSRTFVLISDRADECSRIPAITPNLCEGLYYNHLPDPGDGVLLAFYFDLPTTVPYFEDKRKTLEFNSTDDITYDLRAQRPGGAAVDRPMGLRGTQLTGHTVSEEEAIGDYEFDLDGEAILGSFAAERCDALFDELAACEDLVDP